MVNPNPDPRQTEEKKTEDPRDVEIRTLREQNTKLAERALQALETVGQRANTEPEKPEDPPVEIHPDDAKKLDSYFKQRIGPMASQSQENWEEFARERAKNAAPKELVKSFWPEVEQVMQNTNDTARANLSMWMEAVNIVTGRHYNELRAAASATIAETSESETGAGSGAPGPKGPKSKVQLDDMEQKMCKEFGMTPEEFVHFSSAQQSDTKEA